MALPAEDIEFIKSQLGAWLAEQSLGKPPVVYEIELRERILKVEEELKHQREILKDILVRMQAGFEASNKRFETLQQHMDKRFETLQQQMDKRFDSIQTQMDKRFAESNKRFETLQQQMDKRFAEADKRFDSIQTQMDKRFESLTRRIDQFMIWSFATTLTAAGIVIAVLKLTQ